MFREDVTPIGHHIGTAPESVAVSRSFSRADQGAGKRWRVAGFLRSCNVSGAAGRRRHLSPELRGDSLSTFLIADCFRFPYT